MRTRILIVILLSSLSGLARTAFASNCETVAIRSSIDSTSRDARLCLAPKGHRPLLVFLPSWSGGHPYFEEVVSLATSRGWHLLAPKPRGANEGEIGSLIAIQDVLDAINYTTKSGEVDNKRVYALGVSGGGVHGFNGG